MIIKRLIESLSAVKKHLSHGASVELSIAIDYAQVAAEISIDTRNNALVGGDFPQHFISLDDMASNDIKVNLGEIKESDAIEKAVEIKVSVVIFKNFSTGKHPCVMICGRPQSNNEVNDFRDGVT